MDVAVDRLDHQVFEVGEHVGATCRVTAPPRRRAGDQRLLAEQHPGQLAQVGQQRRVLREPRTERVDDADVAAAARLDESGHSQQRVGPQLEGVAPLGVLAAHDHMHRFEPGDRLQPHVAVADGEVVGLDEGVPQRAGEEAVLEVRLVQGSGGQDDDPGIVHTGRGHLGECPAERGEPRPERFGAAAPQQVGIAGRDDLSVLERVPEARRCLGPVRDHREAAVRAAADICRVQRQVAASAGWHTDAGPQVVAVADDRVDRQDARAQQTLIAEHVCEQQFEHLRTLRERTAEPRPLGPFDHHRDRVERPVLAVGSVQMEHRAVAVQLALDARRVPAECVRAPSQQRLVHTPPRRADHCRQGRPSHRAAPLAVSRTAPGRARTGSWRGRP